MDLGIIMLILWLLFLFKRQAIIFAFIMNSDTVFCRPAFVRFIAPISWSLVLWIWSGLPLTAQYKLTKLNLDSDASLRGVSVVNNKVAWVSGHKGTVALTVDGGQTWTLKSPDGYAHLDFRTIYAFDEQKAIIANAGSPAYILRTSDGGNTWVTVYENKHAAAFIDGADFWNDQDGLVYGDPIDGKMLLLRTLDGGLSWVSNELSPALKEGEASFAASGTGIRCYETGKAVIVTGGQISRLWFSDNTGFSWYHRSSPIIQGKASTGIFSIYIEDKFIITVGGDFDQPEAMDKHIFNSLSGGQTWMAPVTPTRGYRECVENISGKTFVAVGPSGVDWSASKGKDWQALSEVKDLHVVRKARDGNLVLLAGGKGQLYRLEKE